MVFERLLLLLTFTLTYLLNSNIIFVASSKSTFLFERDANKRFTNVTTTFTRNSQLQCGRLCTKAERCDVFNFHTDENICQLCSFYPGNDVLVAEENGWEMFYSADDCLSSPCLNSGTCTETLGSYECMCASSFGGPNCEMATSCMSNWTRFENSCYLFDETQQTVVEARASCIRHTSKAHLVYITSQEEQDFFESLLQYVNTGFGVWLGATFNEQSNEFYWDDGTEFSYTSWEQHEPNGAGQQKFVIAWMERDFRWADVPSYYISSSVCEYEIA